MPSTGTLTGSTLAAVGWVTLESRRTVMGEAPMTLANECAGLRVGLKVLTTMPMLSEVLYCPPPSQLTSKTRVFQLGATSLCHSRCCEVTLLSCAVGSVLHVVGL